MRAKIFKARLFARAIVFMIIASLIFTDVPASGYAGVSGGDKLRTQAEVRRDGGQSLKGDLSIENYKKIVESLVSQKILTGDKAVYEREFAPLVNLVSKLTLENIDKDYLLGIISSGIGIINSNTELYLQQYFSNPDAYSQEAAFIDLSVNIIQGAMALINIFEFELTQREIYSLVSAINSLEAEASVKLLFSLKKLKLADGGEATKDIGLGRQVSVYGPHPTQEGLRPLYERISWARNHSGFSRFVIKNIYAFRDQKHGMAPIDAISFGIVLEDDTFIVENVPVMGGISEGGLEPATHSSVKAAIEFFNKNLSSRFKGLTVAQPDVVTEEIIKIDEEFRKGAEDKELPRFSYIGAEIAVGISMISTIALAELLHVPAEVIINYRYNEYAISQGLEKETRPISIPVDFSVVWEGGKHGVAKHLPDLVKEGIIKDDSRFPARFKDAKLINKGDKSILLAMVPPQELQIMCFAPDWDSAYDIGVKLTNTYKKLLEENGIKTKYGAESGFTTEQTFTTDGKLITLELVLSILEKAVNSLKPDEAKYVRFALDIAASEMYIPEIDMYYIGPDAAKEVHSANVDGLVTNEQFTQYKLGLFKRHPRFISCEDWAADDQIAHWDPSATLIMGKMIQMGDDLDVSRGDLIFKHNALGIQNAHLHKPNQISEEKFSMDAVATSHKLRNVVVWSHRGTRAPQETYTAQGAMGTGSFGSKFTLFGPGRSALIAIMTQANKIYSELGINVPYQGALVLDPNGPYKDYSWARRLREEIGKEVEAEKIKTEYIRLEDEIYPVSGGKALDIMIDKILENSRQILKIPALKISFRKLSDNVVQVFWQFAGINIRRNFTFNTAPGKGVDVNDIMSILKELEENNLDLRKDADYTRARAIAAEKLTARGAVFNFVSDELLPAMRKELSESKRGREILETPSRIFIVPPNVFKKGGMRNIIRKVAELNEVLNIDFAFYGYKTEELNDILGIKNIIAAKSLDELLKGLANRNIEPANVMALIAPEYKDSDDSVKLKEAGVRQIVVPEITTLAMAKAIKEAFSGYDFVREAFNEFLSKALIEDKIILPINPDTQTKILEELKEGVFVFPEQVQPNPDVIKAIEEAVNTEAFQKFTEEFI